MTDDRPEPVYRYWDTWEARPDRSTPQSAGGRAKAATSITAVREQKVSVAAYWLSVDPTLREDRKVANG